MARKSRSIAEAAYKNWIKRPSSNEDMTMYTCYFSDADYAEVRVNADNEVWGWAVDSRSKVIGTVDKGTYDDPADVARELEGFFGCWTHSYKAFCK